MSDHDCRHVAVHRGRTAMFVKLNRLTVETEDVTLDSRRCGAATASTTAARTQTRASCDTAHSGVFNLSEDEFYALLDIMRPRVVEFIDPDPEEVGSDPSGSCPGCP